VYIRLGRNFPSTFLVYRTRPKHAPYNSLHVAFLSLILRAVLRSPCWGAGCMV